MFTCIRAGLLVGEDVDSGFDKSIYGFGRTGECRGRMLLKSVKLCLIHGKGKRRADAELDFGALLDFTTGGHSKHP